MRPPTPIFVTVGWSIVQWGLLGHSTLMLMNLIIINQKGYEDLDVRHILNELFGPNAPYIKYFCKPEDLFLLQRS